MRRVTHSDARKRLLDLIDEIERSVAANNGTFPLSNTGKLTVQAVLRMAGLGPTYLAKKRASILTLRQEVISRLTAIEVLAHRSRVSFNPPRSRKGHYERTETIAVMQRYLEAELEYAATLAELERAQQKIVELQEDIAALKQQVAMVIPLNRNSNTAT